MTFLLGLSVVVSAWSILVSIRTIRTTRRLENKYGRGKK